MEIDHTRGISTPLVRLVQGLGRLPLPLLHALGAGLGCLAYVCSAGLRRKVRNNLTTAGLYSRRLAWASAGEAGRAAIESAWVWFRSNDALLRVTGHAALTAVAEQTLARQAAGDNRGLILLTPHLGCFELAARIYGATAPVTVLYKAPRNEKMHALLKAARSRGGVHPVPADTGGVRALLRALKRGEAVGILPDQVPSAGEGVWAGFFGRPAFTMTLPLRLAEKTGARVCLLAIWRRPGGQGWEVELEELTGLPDPATVNARIEAFVRRRPAQYVWNYNRYKVPAGARPPAAGPTGIDLAVPVMGRSPDPESGG